jgi:hypothetical protein
MSSGLGLLIELGLAMGSQLVVVVVMITGDGEWVRDDDRARIGDGVTTRGAARMGGILVRIYYSY